MMMITNELFKIKAEIHLNSKGGRTLPIVTGYRPGFNFIGKSQTPGLIRLLDRDVLNLGEQTLVEISFVSSELLENIMPGVSFKFYEGLIEIGSGKFESVIGWVKSPHNS